MTPVTVVLTAYQHAAFVREAALSVLAQDYSGPVQVLFSDDASEDGTFDILAGIARDYRGPYQVTARRNSERLGETPHWAAILPHVKGELIVNANGDDVQLPRRVSTLVAAWQGHRPSLLSSNVLLLDETGTLHRPAREPSAPRWVAIDEIAREGVSVHALGATFAMHRSLIEAWGWFDPEEYVGAADLVLPFRAGLLNGLLALGEPLLAWRQHKGQQTRTMAQGEDSDIVRALHDVHLMHGRMQCLRDLNRLRERAPSTVDALRQLLTSRVMEECDWRSKVEARLWQRGLRPRWSMA